MITLGSACSMYSRRDVIFAYFFSKWRSDPAKTARMRWENEMCENIILFSAGATATSAHSPRHKAIYFAFVFACGWWRSRCRFWFGSVAPLAGNAHRAHSYDSHFMEFSCLCSNHFGTITSNVRGCERANERVSSTSWLWLYAMWCRRTPIHALTHLCDVSMAVSIFHFSSSI